MVYAITYDLRNPGQDYSTLYSAIRQLGQTAHPLQNLWLLGTNYSADQVRDALRGVTDSNDYIFVTRLHRGEYSAWMLETDHNWLETRL